MVDWPVTLPQSPLVAGYQEQPENTMLRTDMETGAAKQRRRFTAAPRNIAMSIMLTDAQMDIFEDFFFNDIKGGSISFEWVHPRTGDPATFRFTQMPTYQEITPFLYQVNLPLERLP